MTSGPRSHRATTPRRHLVLPLALALAAGCSSGPDAGPLPILDAALPDAEPLPTLDAALPDAEPLPIACDPTLPSSQPGTPSALVQDAPRVWNLAASSTRLYWVAGTTSFAEQPMTLRSRPVAGGATTDLITLHSIHDIAADDRGVYVSGAQSLTQPVLYWIPAGGGAPVMLATSVDLFELQLTCNWLYGVSHFGLHRIARNDGAALEDLATFQGSRPRIAFDGRDLYAIKGYDVVRLDVRGAPVQTLATLDRLPELVQPIVVDDQYVYIAMGSSRTVVRVAKTGGPATVFTTFAELYPATLAVDADSVYVGGYTGAAGDVFRVNKADGVGAVFVPGAGFVMDVAATRTGLFFSTQTQIFGALR